MELYLDMDGVVADFFGTLESVTGKPYKASQTQEDFNNLMEKHVCGTDFFAKLPKFNSVDKLLDIIKVTFGGYTILSAPLSNDTDNTIANKNLWVDNNLNVLPPRERIFTRDKQIYARGNILIDDYLPNIEKWVAHGGIGIKYKANSNKYSEKDLLRALVDVMFIPIGEFKPQVIHLYKRIDNNI